MQILKKILKKDLSDNHPIILFNEYYEQLLVENDGKTPSRKALKSRDFSYLLPWVGIFEKVEKSDKSTDFYVKLSGSVVVSISGFDTTNHYLSDFVNGQSLEERLKEMDQVLLSGKASFTQSDIPNPNKEHRKIFRGLFPFLDDNNNPTTVVGVLAVETAEAK